MEEEANNARVASNSTISGVTFAPPGPTPAARVHTVPSTIADQARQSISLNPRVRFVNRFSLSRRLIPVPKQLVERASVQYTIAPNNDGNQLESIFGLGPKIKSKLQAARIMTVVDLAQLSDAKCESLKREQNMATIFLLRSRAQERLKELKR
jgi:hypothetical protein